MNEQNETPGGEILVYTAEDGSSRIRVLLEDETVWLTQMMLAELYETTKQNISLHVRNILSEGELDESAVVKDYLTTASDGKQYRVKHYNLDMIIAVGYRVRSPRGTQFRARVSKEIRVGHPQPELQRSAVGALFCFGALFWHGFGSFQDWVSTGFAPRIITSTSAWVSQRRRSAASRSRAISARPASTRSMMAR